jgi:diguanylate cyclase (GGDEF)-like protein
MTRSDTCQYDALVALAAVNRLDALCEAYVLELARVFPTQAITLFGYVDHHDYWRVLAECRPGEAGVALRHESLRELSEEERATRAALGGRFDGLFAGVLDGVGPLTPFRHGLVQAFRVDGQDRMVVVLEAVDAATPREPYLMALGHVFRHQYRRIADGLHDVLTGLLNRASFEEDVTEVLQRVGHLAPDGVWGLALMDIDHFKSINDRFGHLFGDEVLVRIGQVMRRAFREDDRLFRYGGEEFAVLLYARDAQALTATLERFRESVASMAFSQLDRVTISIGYVLVDGSVHHVSALVDCADKALYYAKDHGRNQVQGYQALVESGDIEPVPVADSSIDLF